MFWNITTRLVSTDGECFSMLRLGNKQLFGTFPSDRILQFIFVALRPNAGHGLLIIDVSRSHTTTQHSRQDSSGRVIRSCRDLYLTTHNTHNRHTSMPPVGFEPTISTGERPQTYALDRYWATGTGRILQRIIANTICAIQSRLMTAGIQTER